MKVSDVLQFVSTDPLVAFALLLLLLMAACLLGGVCITYWRDAQEEAAERRRTFDKIMQASMGTPTAPGIRTDRKRVG